MRNKSFAFIIILAAFFLAISQALFSHKFVLFDPTIPLNIQKIMSVDVLPKLFATRNTFVLHTKSGIIPQAEATSYTNDAKAYIAVDLLSGDVLLSKNSREELPIASLTKIMTAIVALDLSGPQNTYDITPAAANQIPTKIGVVPGQRMTLKELLNALLLTSANDAATAIQDGVDAEYGAPIFIDAMNRKAEFLGLKSTSFTNPQGFDSRNNYSSVEDLAILSAYAMQHYPLIQEIVRKDYEFLPEDSRHKQFDLINWNGLIGVYPDTIGMKIGNTGRAKKTTLVVSEREGRKILVAVLGAPDLYSRDLWAAELLDESYEQLLGLPKIDITKEMLQEKYDSWYD